APPFGWTRVPAVSLSFEPANISAIANDIGTEAVFLRQLIAQATAGLAASAMRKFNLDVCEPHGLDH
ncbi:MAG: hypothetical protein M1369_02475, partial [Deinococcus sp.]|nr:hypothetical protein [Deinococcus sp.]